MGRTAAPPAREAGIGLADWLRRLRESAGLSREELAAAIGTDRRNIYRWEIEGHDPGGSVLIRLLSAVGVRLDPPPPGALAAVNAELRSLRARIDETAEAAASRHDEIVARLGAQEEALRLLTLRPPESSPRSE